MRRHGVQPTDGHNNHPGQMSNHFNSRGYKNPPPMNGNPMGGGVGGTFARPNGRPPPSSIPNYYNQGITANVNSLPPNYPGAGGSGYRNPGGSSYPAPPGIISQPSSNSHHRSVSPNAKRLQERQEAKKKREAEAKAALKNEVVLPNFVIVDRGCDDMDSRITDVLGDFSEFADTKAGSNSENFGVEQVPQTPAPVISHHVHDPDTYTPPAPNIPPHQPPAIPSTHRNHSSSVSRHSSKARPQSTPYSRPPPPSSKGRDAKKLSMDDINKKIELTFIDPYQTPMRRMSPLHPEPDLMGVGGRMPPPLVNGTNFLPPPPPPSSRGRADSSGGSSFDNADDQPYLGTNSHLTSDAYKERFSDMDGPNLSEESNDEEESQHNNQQTSKTSSQVTSKSKSIVDEDLQITDDSNDESSSGSEDGEDSSSSSEREEERGAVAQVKKEESPEESQDSKDTKRNTWRLGYLFQRDQSNTEENANVSSGDSKKTQQAESSSQSNSNPRNQSRSSASNQRSSKTSKNSVQRMAAAPPKISTLSDTSDEESITPVKNHTRPTPQSAALPRTTVSTSHNAVSSLSADSSSDEEPKSREKVKKTSISHSKSASKNSHSRKSEEVVKATKGEKASKTIPVKGKRGRKKGPTKVNPEANLKIKSKEHIPTDSSDSEVESIKSTNRKAHKSSSNSSSKAKSNSSQRHSQKSSAKADTHTRKRLEIGRSKCLSYSLGLLNLFEFYETIDIDVSPSKASINTDKNKRECLANVFHGARYRGKDKQDSEAKEAKKKSHDKENVKRKRETEVNEGSNKKMKISNTTKSVKHSKKRKLEEVNESDRSSPDMSTYNKKTERVKKMKKTEISKADKVSSESRLSESESESRVPCSGESTAAYEARVLNNESPYKKYRTPVALTPNAAAMRNLMPSPFPPLPSLYYECDGSHRAIPAVMVKDVPLPADYGERYPIMKSVEGKSINEIFKQLFKRDFNNMCRDHMSYLDEAKKLKRYADENHTDKTLQGTNYLEAVLYFIVSGLSMETVPMTIPSSVTMYTDTTGLISYVVSVFRRHAMPLTNYHNCKVAILCFLCQAALSMKVYTMRAGELFEPKLFVQDHFTRTTKDRILASGNTPASTSGNSSQQTTTRQTSSSASIAACSNVATGSPPSISPTPSPTGSINSESSQSSGYMTSNERKTNGGTGAVGAGGGTTPSPNPMAAATPNPMASATPNPPSSNPMAPGSSSNTPSGIKVEVPLEVHDHLRKFYHTTSFITGGLDHWFRAHRMIEEFHLEEFFKCLDHTVCPLTMHSSLLELVCYVMTAVQEISRDIKCQRKRENSQYAQ